MVLVALVECKIKNPQAGLNHFRVDISHIAILKKKDGTRLNGWKRDLALETRVWFDAFLMLIQQCIRPPRRTTQFRSNPKNPNPLPT